jgi:hypothetical protein
MDSGIIFQDSKFAKDFAKNIKIECDGPAILRKTRKEIRKMVALSPYDKKTHYRLANSSDIFEVNEYYQYLISQKK